MRKLDLENFIKESSSSNFKDLKEKVMSHGWDDLEEFVLLRLCDLHSVITKVLNKELEIPMANDWAEVIEFQEDIEYEESAEELIADVIFELANPDINISSGMEYFEKTLLKLNEYLTVHPSSLKKGEK